MADAPVSEAAEKVRLTFRRLAGLDRSGPPPPQTLAGQPWNVWTIPNGIGFFRLALIPVFLVLALSSDSGTDALPAVLFAVISWSDYFDGIAARITGQYSHFGALLDPFVDRLLVHLLRLAGWLHQVAGKSPTEVVDSIQRDLTAFCASAAARDDITLMVLKVR